MLFFTLHRSWKLFDTTDRQKFIYQIETQNRIGKNPQRSHAQRAQRAGWCLV